MRLWRDYECNVNFWLTWIFMYLDCKSFMIANLWQTAASLTPFNCREVVDCLVFLLLFWCTKVTLKTETDIEWSHTWSLSLKKVTKSFLVIIMLSSQCFPTTTSLFHCLRKIPPLLNKHNSDDRLSNVLCWDNKIAPVFLKIKHFTTSHCALKAHKTNCIVLWFTFISTLWSWFYLLSLSERFIWSINDECKLPGLQQSINMGSDTAISLRLMFKWLRMDIALEEWTCFQISAWLGWDKRAVGGQH